jgi:hypothetical protein
MMSRDYMGKAEWRDEMKAALDEDRDDEDDMTADERKWWQSFKRVVRKMPETVELNARVGAIGIAPSGSRRVRFENDGHADMFCETEWEEVTVPRLDGRDSHL